MVCVVVRRLTSRLPKPQTSLELSQMWVELLLSDSAALIQPQLYRIKITDASKLARSAGTIIGVTRPSVRHESFDDLNG